MPEVMAPDIYMPGPPANHYAQLLKLSIRAMTLTENINDREIDRAAA